MDENDTQPGNVATDPDDKNFDEGLSLLDAVIGPQGREVVERIRQVSPDLGHHVVAYVFGEIYNSDALTVRQRQLATISMLIAQGSAETQLKWHVAAGLNVGLTPTEIMAVAVHSTAYCGFPRALNAAFAVAEVLDQAGVNS